MAAGHTCTQVKTLNGGLTTYMYASQNEKNCAINDMLLAFVTPVVSSLSLLFIAKCYSFLKNIFYLWKM